MTGVDGSTSGGPTTNHPSKDLSVMTDNTAAATKPNTAKHSAFPFGLPKDNAV